MFHVPQNEYLPTRGLITAPLDFPPRFSGTPSDLLPLELGQCHYAKGDDAEILRTMTDPVVVRYRILPSAQAPAPRWETPSDPSVDTPWRYGHRNPPPPSFGRKSL